MSEQNTNKNDAGGKESPATVSLADFEKLKAEHAAAQAKLDAIDRDRKKADDKKRAEAEGHEKLLAEKDAELERLRAATADADKRERARVDSMFAKLPEATRAKLEAVRKDAPLPLWTKLVEAEAGATTTNENDDDKRAPHPPASGAAAGGSLMGASEKNALVPEARKILEERLNRDQSTKIAELMEVKHSPETGAPRFSLPMRVFWKNMPRTQGVVLSTENASKRQ